MPFKYKGQTHVVRGTVGVTGFKLTTPCSLCPFRSDIPPFLRKDRVTEIAGALVNGTFPCHKTLDYDACTDDDEDAQCDHEGPYCARITSNTQHCAGALILMEKSCRSSNYMRIAERLGLYERHKLDMDAPVYASFAQMRRAQP